MPENHIRHKLNKYRQFENRNFNARSHLIQYLISQQLCLLIHKLKPCALDNQFHSKTSKYIKKTRLSRDPTPHMSVVGFLILSFAVESLIDSLSKLIDLKCTASSRQILLLLGKFETPTLTEGVCLNSEGDYSSK